MVVQTNTMDGTTVTHLGTQLFLRLGETPREAMLRQAEFSKPKAPAAPVIDPAEEARKDQRAQQLKATRESIDELKQLADGKPATKPKGFVRMGGSFRAFGGKHTQKPE